MPASDWPRWLEGRLQESLADTPVVLLNGARQTGKSTLAVQIAQAQGRYLSLDEPAVLAAARSDPTAFVSQSPDLLVIDEVQKCPELFAAIKFSVDRDRRPGRFLLTGSADVRTLPSAAESLAGRMEVLSLQPLAQAELVGNSPRLFDQLLNNRIEPGPAPAGPKQGPSLAERACTGGFPEVLQRRSALRRQAWFDAYVLTITQRDVRDLANIADLTALPRLLQLLATRSGALVNVAELSRASGLTQTTLHRYLALLQTTFLYQPLPAWHANLGKRLIKAAKAYLVDSGLMAALVGLNADNWMDSGLKGASLESFVLDQLRRIQSATAAAPQLYHYRSAGGVEVDFVLEARDGRCVGLECKATYSPGERHFRGLADLRQSLGERFASGALLYAGDRVLPFGDRLWALPLSVLWT